MNSSYLTISNIKILSCLINVFIPIFTSLSNLFLPEPDEAEMSAKQPAVRHLGRKVD